MTQYWGEFLRELFVTILIAVAAIMAFAGNLLLARAALAEGAIEPGAHSVIRLASGDSVHHRNCKSERLGTEIGPCDRIKRPTGNARYGRFGGSCPVVRAADVATWSRWSDDFNGDIADAGKISSDLTLRLCALPKTALA
ncbi:MAG: hypothetical protein AAGL10_07255 [Pseudomonadota bacterium]